MNYTEEQKKEIEIRQKEAMEFIAEKGLSLAYIVGKVELKTGEGESVWADRIAVYLGDTKYSKKDDANNPAE